jgi:di/tricarboxylate transporter
LFQIYYTSGIIVLTTIALVLEIRKPAYVLLTAIFLLYVGGVLSVDDVLAGFSNQGMLTVAVLFIIAATLRNSTGFQHILHRILGNRQQKSIYLRLMIPVSFLSAFLNNTPVVAALIPNIKRWARRNDFPVSKLLIPLSYAAILGGMCTLIGTSTNLIVHGLMLENGMRGFGFFELSVAGLPVAIIIIAYFSFFGYRLLPSRKDSFEQLTESAREFVVEVKIEKEYPYIGKNIEQANLRHLKGLYLFQIIRDNREIAPLEPSEVIHENDRLFFTGMPGTILEMIKTPGFRLIKDHEYDIRNIDSDKHKTFEAVISNSSPLIGESVRDSGFRTKYNAVILAIHRNGERIRQKVGDIEFQANDTLFLLADTNFENRWYRSSDFSLVSRSVHEYSKPAFKGNIALLLTGLMVLAVATGLIRSMLVAAAVTAGIMVLAKIISYHDARQSIDINVLLLIVAALGISRAVTNSGVADAVAGFLIRSLAPLGSAGIIAVLFFITSVYTELITNNAAAAIVFPIALATAQSMDIPAHPLMITIAIAASSSFATPIGYQTNLMVYSAGGYKFRDFFRTGAVINLITGVITTVVVWWVYFR